jgi:hypothetical protein
MTQWLSQNAILVGYAVYTLAMLAAWRALILRWRP